MSWVRCVSCFLPPPHVEGLFKNGDRVRVHGQKILHFKSARSVLLADRAAVGWPTRTTLKGITGLAGETIDLATMADPPVPGVQVINVPALEEEEFFFPFLRHTFSKVLSAAP